MIVNNAALGADHGDKVPDVKWAKDTFYANVIGIFIYLYYRHNEVH